MRIYCLVAILLAVSAIAFWRGWPTPERLALRAGWEHYQAKNYVAAISTADALIATNNQLSDAYRLRAFSLLRQGNFGKSIEDLTVAIHRYPRDASVYDFRAHAFVETKQYANAISDLDVAIDIHPHFSWSYEERGVAFLKLGDPALSCVDFVEAASLDGADESTLPYLRHCTLRDVNGPASGELEALIQTVGQPRTDKWRSQYARAVAWSFNSITDYDRGLVAAQKALALDANSAYAKRELGIALLYVGKVDQSLPLLTSAVESFPDNSRSVEAFEQAKALLADDSNMKNFMSMRKNAQQTLKMALRERKNALLSVKTVEAP